MASAYAGSWQAPGASSDTAAWGGTPSDAAAWSAYYAQYPQGSYPYPANAYYGYQGYAEYPPPAPAEEATKPQPPAPGDEQPPLPLDEAPPGAVSSGSEASATTTSATIPPAPPGAPAPPVPAITSPFAPVSAAVPAYDHAAYHQYYLQYYSAYGQYPQAHDASAYAAPQGYIAPPSAPAHTQPPHTQHSMSYSMSQSMSQELPKTPYAPPGPRPPPGGPPSSSGKTSTYHNSYNSVPPPNALTGSNKIPVNGLRHQYNIKPNQPTYASATARHPSGSSVTSTTAPAFIRADPAPKPSQPSTTPSASIAKPPAGAGKFPPSFNTWVERCFERCRNDVERQAMTGKLTVRIKAVEATGSMWGVDWDREPVPDLNAPTPSPANLPSPSSQGGLPSKRSRWEESNTTQYQSQHPNQKGGPKQKQQANQKNKKQRTDSKWDPNWSRVEEARRAERAGRFGNISVGRNRNRGGYDSDEDGSDWSEGGTGGVIVVGTSTNLEKSYFRLTGPPDPAEVRPPPVLRKALDRLVRLLREDAASTFYTLDQFKGLRQDCTVQHLRNELAVEVYEAHARSSLEYGDLAEFNQCQTQLAAMYTEGVPGCVVEFTAYKLLYNVVHARSGANKALLHTLKAALTQQRSAPDPHGAIANALAVRAAMAAGNHPAFFSAYAKAPALGRALLDSIVPHVRWSALNVMVKAYKTSLPLSFVARALGFIASGAAAALGSSEAKGAVALPGCRQAEFTGKAVATATEDEGVQACAQWLQAHGAVLEAADTPSPLLDVKSSMGKLFIPEEPKVAHGDDNLSLTDFLARASGLKA